MRQRRVTNFEQHLDKVQEDAAQDDEQRGIFEVFDRDEPESEQRLEPKPESDEDAPLQRDNGE